MMDWRKTYPGDLLIPYDYDPHKYDPRAWDPDHQLTRRIDKLETEIKAYVQVAHIMSLEGDSVEEVKYVESPTYPWQFSGKRLVARETIYDKEYGANRTSFAIYLDDEKRHKQGRMSLDIIEANPEQRPGGYASQVLGVEFVVRYAGGLLNDDGHEMYPAQEFWESIKYSGLRILEARPVPVRPVLRARPESGASKLFFKLLLYGFIAYAVVTLYRGIVSVLAD